jgi:divalent metal cation (Fe/Co/Zn/Cd) transporter
MDGVDPDLVDTAEAALAAEPGVTEVRNRLHADAELDVDPGTSLNEAHRIAHEAEHTLTHAVPKLSSALVHVYPATTRTHQ